MDSGTWADWFGAGGSIAAAGGALWLLWREGQARERLQESEIQRVAAERRHQASRVYLSEPVFTGAVTGDVVTGGREWHVTFQLELVNGSEAVVNNLRVQVLFGGRYVPTNYDNPHIRVVGRVLPNTELPIKLGCTYRTDNSVNRVEDLAYTVEASATFEDAAGVCWRLNADHSLIEC